MGAAEARRVSGDCERRAYAGGRRARPEPDGAQPRRGGGFFAKPVGADEVGRRRDVAEQIIGLSAQGKQPEAFIPFWTEGQKVRNDCKEG